VTWREWKAWIEAQGVKDDDEIDYIDCHFPIDAQRETTHHHNGTETTAWVIW